MIGKVRAEEGETDVEVQPQRIERPTQGVSGSDVTIARSNHGKNRRRRVRDVEQSEREGRSTARKREKMSGRHV